MFPYINAEAEKPAYYDDPHSIHFALHGLRCVLHPHHLDVAAFETRDQALEFFESFLEFLNDLHDRKDGIEPDRSLFKPVPVFPIFKLLPGTNCKACGFPTCMAFAASLSQRESSLDACPTSSRETTTTPEDCAPCCRRVSCPQGLLPVRKAQPPRPGKFSPAFSQPMVSSEQAFI